MHSTHGFFLTCKQKSPLFLHNAQSIDIYTMYKQWLVGPLTEIWRSPTYLEGPGLAHGGDSPSTLAPCLIATAPPFDSDPFTHFPPPQPTSSSWTLIMLSPMMSINLSAFYEALTNVTTFKQGESINGPLTDRWCFKYLTITYMISCVYMQTYIQMIQYIYMYICDCTRAGAPFGVFNV